MNETPTGLISIGLALALLFAPGCPGGPETPSSPRGFAPAHGWSVLVDAEPSLSHPTASSPLLDPRGLGVVDSDNGSALVVFESAAWRVRRYPIVSTAPLGLGDADTAFMFGGERGRVGSEAGFAAPTVPRFAVSADGSMVLTGPEGLMWFVGPDGEAQTLGSLGGAKLHEGALLGGADLSDVVGLDLASMADGTLRLLLIASEAVWAAEPVDRVHPGLAAVTRVAGSGGRGEPETAMAARLAPLDFGRGGSVITDSEGNLFLSTQGGGRLWAIADYRDEASTLQLLAGGGDSVSSESPPTERLLEPMGLGFALVEDGSTRSLFYLNAKRPMRLQFEFAAGTASEVTLSVASDRGYPLFGGLAVIGSLLVVADASTGAVNAHAPEQQGATIGVLAGPPTVGERGVAGLIPTPLRPSGVLTSSNGGQERVLYHDQGGGSVNSVGSGAGTAVLQRPETRFGTLHNLAIVPATERNPEWLLVASQNALVGVLLGTDASVQLTRGTSAILSLDGSPLSGFFPQSPPDLVGTASNGSLVFVGDGALVQAIPADPSALDHEAELDLVGGTGTWLPVGREPIGINTLSMKNVTAASMGPGDLVTLVLKEELQGDLVVLATLASYAADTVAGREVRPRSATLVFGGGSQRPQPGLQGTDIGLRGVGAAATVGSEVVVALTDGLGGAILAKIDAAGAFDRVTAPLAAQVSDRIEVDLAELHLGREVVQLERAPCLGDSALVALTGERAWVLNFGPSDLTLPGGEIVGSGRAAVLTAGSVTAVACLDDALVVLVGTDAGPVLTDLRGWELDAPSVVDFVSHGRELVLSAVTDEGGEIAVAAPDDGLLTTVTGLSHSLMDGRELWRAGLPNRFAVFAAAASPEVLFSLVEGELLAIHPVAGSGYTQTSKIETVWTGAPLNGRAEGVSVEASDAEKVTLLVSCEGQVHRLTIPTPRGAPYVANHGESSRVAGGGADYPGLGGSALSANLRQVHGLVVDGRGRIWLRWDRYVGYIDEEDVLIAVAGGGSRPASTARTAWELALPTSTSTHPDLAVTETGRLITTDAASGLLIALTP